MPRKPPSWSVGAISAICCAIVPLSCGGSTPFLRLAPNPPDFRYISNAELESVMWQLAGQIHELERLTQHQEPQAAELSALLHRIEAAARTLNRNGDASNHPYLQNELDKFLGMIERADRDLQRTPPEIVHVDDVWRACSGCHAR